MARQNTNRPKINVYRSSQMLSQIDSYNHTQTNKTSKQRHKFIWLLILFLSLGGVVYGIKGSARTVTYNTNASSKMIPVTTAPTSALSSSQTNVCLGNKISKEVIVKIRQRHLWACDYQNLAYSSPVITGYIGNPADVTPTGTYSVFAKETNITLTGNDGTSTWHDPVHFWMPFLFNQYGAYGFHDAPWRSANQFGNISNTSPDASHGCIEFPYATAKFLYGWTHKGTLVKVMS